MTVNKEPVIKSGQKQVCQKAVPDIVNTILNEFNNINKIDFEWITCAKLLLIKAHRIKL